MVSATTRDIATATGSAHASIRIGPAGNQPWHGRPSSARRALLEAVGRQWYALWNDRLDFAAIPPAAWGWNLQDDTHPLVPPPALARRRTARMAQHELMVHLADWLFGASPLLGDRDRTDVISGFAQAGALDASARRMLTRRLYRTAQRHAADRALDLFRETLAEANHHCRQTVTCRGLWLPDPSLTADEIRHLIESTFRSRPAEHAQEQPASEMTALLDREEILIRRYRAPAGFWPPSFLRGPSAARRAWATCTTLHRLGLPVPQPIGLLEIMQGGAVSHSFIVARVTPLGARASPCGNHRRVQDLCAAWLRLLDRGVSHAVPIVPHRPGGLDAESALALCWANIEVLRIGSMPRPFGWFFALRRLYRAAHHALPPRDQLVFLAGLVDRWPLLRIRAVRRLLAPSRPT